MIERPENSVIIVDSHPLSREGLKSMLRGTGRFREIYEAENSTDGLKKTEMYKPKLAFVEPDLPDENGFLLTKRIKEISIEIKVIIFTIETSIDIIRKTFQLGADGLLLKEVDRDLIEDAITNIEKNLYYIDSRIIHHMVEELKKNKFIFHKRTKRTDENLTKRENQILTMIASGFSTRDIADRLYISIKTVENHRSSILRKLGLRNTAELVIHAIRSGLVDIQ